MSNFPKLALGTWGVGGCKDPDPENDDQKDIEVIRLAIESGIELIDTAQNYADGRCEEIIGEALAIYPRQKYKLLTKQRKERLEYAQVVEDCKASIDRLKVEYLDYLLCHAPNPESGIGEFFQATDYLVEQGLVKNVGVSNFGPSNLALALKMSKYPVVVNQVHFSVDDDDILETKTYDFCVENNITVQAYRAITNIAENKLAFEIVSNLGIKYGLSPEMTALAYLNSYEGVSFTIRASSKKHWEEIKDATNLVLDENDIAKIRNTHTDIKGMFRHFLV